MHVTLRQFEIFRAVASTGTVTAAARKLCMSQPAASMSLSELEKQLGQLFERHHRLGLILNDAGRALLPKANEMIERAREIELQFSSNSLDIHGELKISASSTIGNNLLPGIIADFRKKHPNIRTCLHINNSRDIENQLLDFDTDIALTEGICMNPDIIATQWQEDELVIICHPQHPLAHKKNMAIDMLANEPWIVREPGSGTRELFDAMIATHLGEPVISMVFNRAEAIKRAVHDGIGIACMSSISARNNLADNSLKILDIKNLSLKRYFYVLTHRQKYWSEALQAFYNFINPDQKD